MNWRNVHLWLVVGVLLAVACAVYHYEKLSLLSRQLNSNPLEQGAP